MILLIATTFTARTTVRVERAFGWSFPVSATSIEFINDVRSVQGEMRQACMNDIPQAEIRQILARRDALQDRSEWGILRSLVFNTHGLTHAVRWQCAYRGSGNAYVIMTYTMRKPRRTS